MFDPGGHTSHLGDYSFLEGRRALLRRGVTLDAAMVSEAGAFVVVGGLKHVFFKRSTSDLVCRTLFLRQIVTFTKLESNWTG